MASSPTSSSTSSLSRRHLLGLAGLATAATGLSACAGPDMAARLVGAPSGAPSGPEPAPAPNNSGNGGGGGDSSGPTTEGPTSEGPTSEGPTSEGPTSEGPTSEGPTSEGPTSEHPSSPSGSPSHPSESPSSPSGSPSHPSESPSHPSESPSHTPSSPGSPTPSDSHTSKPPKPSASATSAKPTGGPAVVPPTGVLKELADGNARWAAGKPTRPDQSPDFRKSLVAGQNPEVVFIACTDSRVPPEMVFDQGLDKMVVVRTAGEAVDDLVLGSVEAGVDAGAKVIYVLGHENCDVLADAVKAIESNNGVAPGHQQAIVDAVKPAYTAAKAAGGKTANTIVTEQIRAVMATLARDPNLTGVSGLTIVGGEYELDTGKVTMVS